MSLEPKLSQRCYGSVPSAEHHVFDSAQNVVTHRPLRWQARMREQYRLKLASP